MSTLLQKLSIESKVVDPTTFSDDFEDGTIDSEWTVVAQTETIVEEASVLKFEFDTGTNLPWDENNDAAMRVTYTNPVAKQATVVAAKIGNFRYGGTLNNHFSGIYMAKEVTGSEDRDYAYRFGIHVVNDVVKLRADIINGASLVVVKEDTLTLQYPFWIRIVRTGQLHKYQYMTQADYTDDLSAWTDWDNTSINILGSKCFMGMFMENPDINGTGESWFSNYRHGYLDIGTEYSVYDYGTASDWKFQIVSDSGDEPYTIIQEENEPVSATHALGTHAILNAPADATENRSKGAQLDVYRFSGADAGERGLAVCRSDEDNFYGYVIDMDTDMLYFVKYVGGSETVLASAPVPITLEDNSWYTLGVSFDSDDKATLTAWFGYTDSESVYQENDVLLIKDTAHTTGKAAIISNGGSVFMSFGIVTLLGSIASSTFPDLRHRVCVESAPLERITAEYNDALGAAFTTAVSSLVNLQDTLDDFITDQQDLNKQYDSVLAVSAGDVSTLNDFATERGLIVPVDGDPTKIAQLLESRYSTTVVGGLLLNEGDISLDEIRQLYQLLGCDLDRLRELLTGTFILLWTYQTTVTDDPTSRSFYDPCTGTTVTVDEPCATSTTVTVTVTETLAGINIAKSKAASDAGKQETELLGYVFWLGDVSSDSAVVARLATLGVAGETLAAVLTGDSTEIDGFTTIILDQIDVLEILTALGLTDSEINTLLCDLTLPSIDATTDFSDILAGMNKLLGSGATNDLGNPEDGTTSAALAAASVSLPRLFALADAVEDAADEEENEWCQALLSLLQSSTEVLVYLGDFIQSTIGAFAVDASANIGLEKEMSADGLPCIVAPSVGISVSLQIPAIGEALQALAASFLPISISITAAVESINLTTCIPRALLSALTGGGCSSDIPDVSSLCTELVDEAIEAMNAMLEAQDLLLTSLLSSIRTMQLNLSIAIELQASFESELDLCNPAPVTALLNQGIKLLEG